MSADTRARLVNLWDRVHTVTPPQEWPRLDLIIDAPTSRGWWVWRAGGPGGAMTALPALTPGAPFMIWRRYLARVVANTTGRCPLCASVAAITGPPHDRPASWALLPVRVGITHAPDCPATFTDDETHHFEEIQP